MTDVDLGPFNAAVRATLEGPLSSRGFDPGQGNDLHAPAWVLFCAPFETIQRRWPDLLEAVDALHGYGHPRTPGTCIDLVIEGSVDRVHKAELDAIPLDDLAGSIVLEPKDDLARQLDALLAWVELVMPVAAG
jgi:hypothetical protein